MHESGKYNFTNKRFIVIAGPTASGKTSLAVSVAKRLNCSIISADSRQFYKELSIGTAKPTLKEMDGVPHYFVDSHSVTQPLSSGEFEQKALEITERLFQKDDFIVLVGGSGMFIDALVYGTDNLPHKKEVREFWNKQFEEKGIEYLQKELLKVDPNYYHKVDLDNPVRLIRALEVFQITQQSFSSLRQQKDEPRFKTHYFILDWPREILYERINQRVDIMIENGLIEEVKTNAIHRHLQSLNTVGYKEIFSFLDGEITKEKAIDEVKKNTRRYAKRQLTWFRRKSSHIWLNPESTPDLTSEILKIINSK